MRARTVILSAALTTLLGCGQHTTTVTIAPARGSSVRAGVAAEVEPTDPLQDIEARVARIQAAYDVPGLSIAIVKDGTVVHLRGYGVRQRGKNDEVDENTTFAIASNTKAFAATAVALAVHDGKLGWDDKVKDRLPGFRMNDPHATDGMLVRDLLCHRSGLDTWAGDLAWIGANIDTPTLMKRLRFVEPRHGLRANYGYTNLMFMVAGEVLRQATDKAWDAHVRERILEPLGMNRTTVSLAELKAQDNVATPHQGEGENEQIVPYLNVDMVGAAASLSSSAADLSRWLLLQTGNGRVDGKQVVPAEVIDMLRVPHTSIPLAKNDMLGTRHFVAYGLGWFMYDYHGHLVVTHSGGLPGMTSRTTIVPEIGLGVVVLTNSETAASTFIAYDVVDAYLGVEARDYVALSNERRAAREKDAKREPKAERAPASVAPNKLAGNYDNPLLGKAVVSHEAGTLTLRIPEHGGLDCPMTHAGADSFSCVWDNPIMGTSEVTFEVERGRAKRLKFKVRPEFIDPVEYVFAR